MAGSSDVTIRFVGDSKSAVIASKEVGASLETLGTKAKVGSTQLAGVEQQAAKVGGGLQTMTKHILSGVVAFAGFSVGAKLIEGTVHAAQDAQVAHSLMAQQVRNVGLSYEANAPAIDAFIAKSSALSGFTRTELTGSFTTLIRVTKDVSKAQADMTIAMDLARLKNIDLETATNLVAKAQLGMVGGLKRMGIDVTQVTTNVDALKAAHDRAATAAAAHGQKIEGITKDQLDAAKAADKLATTTGALAKLHELSAGSAEKYGKTAAGAMDRFRAAAEELQVKLGNALLPTIGNVADKANRFVSEWDKAGTTAFHVHEEADKLAETLKTLGGAANDVADAVGGWKTVLEGLLALKMASVVNGWVGSLNNMIGGTAAGGSGLKGASAEAKTLHGQLASLKALGAISLIVELVLNKSSIDKWLKDNHLGIFTKSGKSLLDSIFGGDPTSSFNPTNTSSGAGVALPGLTGGQAIQLPTSQTATHQTENLPGFPAVDIMAKPGTPIRAPENGMITRISGHEPTEPPPLGQGGPWGLSIYFLGTDTGNTYYMTHLVKVGRPGGYKKGEVIGIIGDYPGSSSDHVHFAIHEGDAGEAHVPSGLFSPGDFIKGSGTGSLAAPPSSQGDPSKRNDPTFEVKPKKPKVDPLSKPAAKLAIDETKQQLKDITQAFDDVAPNLRGPIDKALAEARRLLTGVVSKRDLQKAKSDLADAKHEIANAMDWSKELKLAQPDLVALNKDLLDHILPPKLAGQVKGQIDAFNKYVAEAMSDHRISDAELAHIKTLQTALHARAKAIADEMAYQAGIVKDAMKTLSDTINSEAATAGIAVAQIFTPKDIRALGDRAAAITKQLNSIDLPKETADKLKGELDGLDGDIKTGLDELAKNVNDARANVDKAWETFADHILDGFDKIRGAFQAGLDDVAAQLNSKQLTDSLTRAQAAFEKVVGAGGADQQLAALMSKQIDLWKEYYADLAAQNFDGAKGLQDALISSQDAIDDYLASLPDDQRQAAQAIIDAGGTLLDAIKATGEANVAAATKSWDELTVTQRAAIEAALADAQTELDKGTISLPEALSRVRTALVDNGMPPEEADKLLHDPITGSLSKAVTTLNTAIGILIGVLTALAKALGIPVPDMAANAQAGADAITGPYSKAADDMDAFAARIGAAAMSIAQSRADSGYDGPIGGPKQVGASGSVEAFRDGGVVKRLVRGAYSGMQRVPGNRGPIDNVWIRTSPGEMILTDRQQAQLFAMANGHGGGAAAIDYEKLARTLAGYAERMRPINMPTYFADANPDPFPYISRQRAAILGVFATDAPLLGPPERR